MRDHYLKIQDFSKDIEDINNVLKSLIQTKYIKPSNYNVYSYNLFPNNYQPSGSANYSFVTNNIPIGQSHGQSITTGSYGVIIGENAPSINLNELPNIPIGHSQGQSITTGSNSIVIGENAPSINLNELPNIPIGEPPTRSTRSTRRFTGNDGIPIGYNSVTGIPIGQNVYIGTTIEN